jgi:hypothetical protein
MEIDMSTVQSVATKICSKYYGTNSAFDPAIIFVIAEVVVQLIQAFQECQKQPTDPPATLKSHPVMARMFVRSRLRDYMSIREFRKYRGEDLVDATIETGHEMSSQDWNAVYSEVKNGR